RGPAPQTIQGEPRRRRYEAAPEVRAPGGHGPGTAAAAGALQDLRPAGGRGGDPGLAVCGGDFHRALHPLWRGRPAGGLLRRCGRRFPEGPREGGRPVAVGTQPRRGTGLDCLAEAGARVITVVLFSGGRGSDALARQLVARPGASLTV